MFWVKDTLGFVQSERTITATFKSEKFSGYAVFGVEQIKSIRDGLNDWLARMATKNRG